MKTILEICAFVLLNATLLCLSIEAESRQITVLSKLEQSKLQNKILTERLDNLLPELMRKNNIDCWVIVSEEYNEDPIMKSLLPSTRISARQLSVIVFLDHGKTLGVERLLAARFEESAFYKQMWNLNSKTKQWDEVIKVIEQFKPKKIAINYSNSWSHADGISKTNHQNLFELLNSDLRKKLVSAENLAVEWLATLTPIEVDAYKQALFLSRAIVKDLLSEENISLGSTTTSDLKWGLVQKVSDLGLNLWFQPFISVKRSDREQAMFDITKEADPVIRAGDVLFIGLGLSYLGYNTDTQENAYILREGEEREPYYLTSALENTIQLQNIIAANLKSNFSGNQVLLRSLKQSKLQKLNAKVYSHPIGIHGHGAGALVGLWEQQEGVSRGGNSKILTRSVYAVEGTTYSSIPEWSEADISISLAHVAYIDGENVKFLAPRQFRFHLVRYTKS